MSLHSLCQSLSISLQPISASGTMSWIIPAEIFNTATRVKGMSLATMVSFAFNTMIGQVTPVALAKIGWRYYILFVVCDVTNALFFYLFLPETKGVTLEAMNDLFLNSPIVVPGSHWQPPLEVNVDRVAEKISAQGQMENVEVVSEKVATRGQVEETATV
jgi:hypothetical protein